jgi:hypothetical protein
MVTKQEQAGAEAEQRQQAAQETQERGRLEGLIRERVLRDLGRPAGLRCVDVRRLWGDNYRVNVLVGPDVMSSKVAHSYFLAADGSGQILTVTPAITRLYEIQATGTGGRRPEGSHRKDP